MQKNQIGYLLIISLLISTLSACTNAIENSDNATAIMPNATYYSVTTGDAYHEKNHYMDVDIRIPKITYTGTSSDVLFDTINDEMHDKLSNLIDTAKNNAENSYKKYLETAKNNIISDRDLRLNSLEEKYKNVITETEIGIINSTIEKFSQKSTFSNIVEDIANSNDDILKETDTEANGFTDTSTTIDPNLHNKNIIVIETTKIIEETNTNDNIIQKENNNSHGDIPPFNAERPMFTDGEKPDFDHDKKTDFNNSERSNFTKDQSNTDDIDKSNKKNNKNLNVNNKISTSSNIIKNGNLTIDDFYKEINEINNTIVPSDRELTLDYTPTKILCNFDVKCLDEDFLSLFVELQELKTAPSVIRLFYNIDLHKKEIIKINDVLGDDYKNICINSINASIENFTDNQKNNLKANYNVESYINDNTAFFINNNHVPVVALDKFTITPVYLEFQIIK